MSPRALRILRILLAAAVALNGLALLLYVLQRR